MRGNVPSMGYVSRYLIEHPPRPRGYWGTATLVVFAAILAALSLVGSVLVLLKRNAEIGLAGEIVEAARFSVVAGGLFVAFVLGALAWALYLARQNAIERERLILTPPHEVR